MGVILQVALPSRVLAAARLQCGAAGAGASRGLGVCAEHARLAARGESPRAMEIGDFLVGLGPGGNSQCAGGVLSLLINFDFFGDEELYLASMFETCNSIKMVLLTGWAESGYFSFKNPKIELRFIMQ